MESSFPKSSASSRSGGVLQPIDEGPIRRKALQKCRRILTRRSQAQKELDAFNERDLPAYERWVHSLFGAMLTEMREEEERLFELRELFEEVEAEALMSGVSEEEAYLRVKERREGRAEEESDAEETEEEEPEFDENDEEFREAFRERFGSDPEDYAEEMHRRRLDELSGKGARDGADGDIKELYRKLVRQLHPDVNGEVAESKKELWHAVQEAYRRGDCARLRELAAQCGDCEEDAIGEQTPVSKILALWENARRALRSIRAELRRARKDPAWNFANQTPAQRERAAAVIREDFDIHIEQRRTLREDIEEQIKIWEDLSVSRAAAKRKRKRVSSMADDDAGPAAGQPDSGQMRFSFE